MKYIKIELPYEYNQLEPVVDALTVEKHYTKHHSAYESKFNSGISNTELENYNSIEELMLDYINIDDQYKTLVRNAGGGLINHNLYWKQFTNEYKVNKDLIVDTWGSIESFKDEMIEKGLSIFGSGWVWLVNDNGLKIITTPNQENPWMQGIKDVIIGVDVWEHAYYLKYKEDRKTYIESVIEMIINK